MILANALIFFWVSFGVFDTRPTIGIVYLLLVISVAAVFLAVQSFSQIAQFRWSNIGVEELIVKNPPARLIGLTVGLGRASWLLLYPLSDSSLHQLKLENVSGMPYQDWLYRFFRSRVLWTGFRITIPGPESSTSNSMNLRTLPYARVLHPSGAPPESGVPAGQHNPISEVRIEGGRIVVDLQPRYGRSSDAGAFPPSGAVWHRAIQMVAKEGEILEFLRGVQP